MCNVPENHRGRPARILDEYGDVDMAILEKNMSWARSIHVGEYMVIVFP